MSQPQTGLADRLPDSSTTPPSAPRRSALRRFLPLAIIVVGIVILFASGLPARVNFDALATNYAALQALIAANPVGAAILALALYALSTALSFPLGWLLTVAFGLVFGWFAAALIVVFGATIGAVALFLATRYALADLFRRRAGDRLNTMAEGFRADATSYMLFLRLAPVFPFALVNVVPAILGVPLLTYAWTTFVGIIPGTIAYAYAGEGLRSVVAQRADACALGQPPCGTPFSAGDLVTREMLIAFVLLAVVSLLPALVKRLRRRPSKAE